VLVIAGVVSLLFVFVLVAWPVQRRLALRYPFRRLTEAALVIAGSLLGTGIITGSLIVGNTIDRSIRASAYEQLGPIDEVIAVSGLQQGAALAEQFADFRAPVVDGMLPFAVAPAAVVGGGLSQPRAQVVEVDFAAAHGFGGDPSAAGIDGPTPLAGHAVITSDLARRIAVGRGDQIVVFSFGRSLSLTVDRVVGRVGVAGFWSIDKRQQSYNVLVGPGTLAAFTRGVDFGAAGGLAPPTSYLAFSNVGGVESGSSRTDAATSAIESVLGADITHVQPVKRNLLVAAATAGDSLTQLYFTLGMFAVAAGILLLVNVFVMLSDDRRSELGMLRAVGMRRVRLVAAFTTEGWLYSIVASALGALAGIGVGRVIAWRADQILGSGEETTALNLTFSFEWSTVTRGFAIGFLISLATILATAVRVSRLNVIAAIRDLPASARKRVRRRPMEIAAVGAVAGTAITVLGFSAPNAYAVMLGPVVAAVGIGVVLARRLPRRVIVPAVAAVVLLWGAGFIAVLGAIDIPIGVPIFLVQGLTMAGAAVTLVTRYQGAIARGLGRLSRGALSARVGVSYPVARRFRTAMTLGMFALIVLTLVYLSILSLMFRNQVDAITADLSGGFNTIVTSNPTDPIPVGDLRKSPGVAAVAPLSYGVADFTVPGRDTKRWAVTAFGTEFATSPPAMRDTGTYPSAVAAWRAVLADPSLIIVDQYFLRTGGGPATEALHPGDHLTIADPVSGAQRAVTIAAIATDDFLGNGAFYGAAGYAELFGERAVPSRFYVAADDPSVTERIRRQFLANGADAQTIRSIVDSVLAQNTSFFTLMEQFVGVGLVVAVGGIGVTMVRAVRERRREVGVFRAIGFRSGVVARAFMIEAIFVALEGVAIGVVVALIGSYGLVSSDNTFTDGFVWAVPWGEVLIVVAIAVGTSAIAALWPARHASQIRPAVALRISD